jgi:hypothetical protein
MNSCHMSFDHCRLVVGSPTGSVPIVGLLAFPFLLIYHLLCLSLHSCKLNRLDRVASFQSTLRSSSCSFRHATLQHGHRCLPLGFRLPLIRSSYLMAPTIGLAISVWDALACAGNTGLLIVGSVCTSSCCGIHLEPNPVIQDHSSSSTGDSSMWAFVVLVRESSVLIHCSFQCRVSLL